VKLELDGAQAAAEKAIQDTAGYRDEIKTSRHEFFMAFFANVFVVNHILPWLDKYEKSLFMSTGHSASQSIQRFEAV
jgi:hypothetical protein